MSATASVFFFREIRKISVLFGCQKKIPYLEVLDMPQCLNLVNYPSPVRRVVLSDCFESVEYILSKNTRFCYFMRKKIKELFPFR